VKKNTLLFYKALQRDTESVWERRERKKRKKRKKKERRTKKTDRNTKDNHTNEQKENKVNKNKPMARSHGLVQCFSTWVPRNLQVPPK
jgi:hypothetical protein